MQIESIYANEIEQPRKYFTNNEKTNKAFTIRIKSYINIFLVELLLDRVDRLTTNCIYRRNTY